MPRFSGDQARQAVENDAEDRLIGGARRQVDLDLLFQFDDAGGDFDEAQPQSVELHDAPSRAFGHQPAHRPEEPVGTGVKEEAKLVGRSLMAGGAVGGEMVLPRLDMVFRLTARAVEPLIERLGATALQVGDDKASIGSLGAGLDPRDNALDPAPAAGSIVELRKAPHLAARRCHGEALGSGFLQRLDMAPQQGADLVAAWPLARAQQRGDETPLAIKHDDRLEAVIVMKGVEQA